MDAAVGQNTHVHDDQLSNYETTVRTQLETNRTNGDGDWRVYEEDVVFVAGEHGFVFDGKEFNTALALRFNRYDDDAFHLLTEHCKEYSKNARGQKALRKYTKEFGVTPVVD